MNKQDNSAKKIIKTNNQLREKLTDENKKYYEQLLLYIRTAGLFYDNHEIESLLLQILQDIISAQNDKQSAEKFFGKSPQAAADELIHNLGKSSKKEILKLVGLVFGISSFFTLLNTLTTQGKGINILVLILNGLVSFLFVGIIVFIMHKSIYTKIIKKKFISFLLLWLISVLVIGSFILIQLFTPSILTIYLSDQLGIFIISILVIGTSIAVFSRNKEDRQLWLPFLPFIWILGIIGIVLRLPLTRNWISSSTGKISAAILTSLGIILVGILTHLNLKEKKK